jgi:cell division protein FtsW
MIKLDGTNTPRKQKVQKTKTKKEKSARVINYERVINSCRRLRPKNMNLSILLSVIALSVFGLIMVYSASSYNAQIYFGNRYYYFNSQLIGFVLGLVALSLTYIIDYRAYAKFKWVFLGVGAGLLLLVFVPGIGIEKLGAKRWIGVGGFSMQPSEVAKFCFVIFCAAVAAGSIKKAPVNILGWKQVVLILAAGGGFCGLILAEPNLSITLCLGLTMFIMLYLCGAKKKHLALLIAPMLVLLPIMLVAEPYRVRRLVAFVDPWATPKAEGFQLIQSLFGLGNGGFFGVGFGNSTQKHMFLPFAESDFIFSIVGEEFGLFGCILFMALLGFLIFKIFQVGIKCPDHFGKFLCFGVGVVIFVQSFINLAVVTGSIPPTGLPLPFISFGGTSLAVFLGAVGMVLNVHKQNLAR